MSNIRIFHQLYDTDTESRYGQDKKVKLFRFAKSNKKKALNIEVSPGRKSVYPVPKIWVCCESRQFVSGFGDHISILFYSSSFWIVKGTFFSSMYLILRVGYDAEHGKALEVADKFIDQIGKRMSICLSNLFEYVKNNFKEMYERVEYLHDYVMCKLISYDSEVSWFE